MFTKETAKEAHIGCYVRWVWGGMAGPDGCGDGQLIRISPHLVVRRSDRKGLWNVDGYELIEDTLSTNEIVVPSHLAKTTKSIIESTSKKQPLMKTISNTLKRILSPAQQTLYRAGFIDSQLELTREGESALTDHLRFEYEAALVKMAEEKLAEEKGNETK